MGSTKTGYKYRDDINLPMMAVAMTKRYGEKV